MGDIKLDRAFVIVTNPGDFDEQVVEEGLTLRKAYSRCKYWSKQARGADIFRRLPDGSLTAEY